MSQATVKAASPGAAAQPGVDAAERAVVGEHVGHHRQPERRVELRGVGDDEDLVGDRARRRRPRGR